MERKIKRQRGKYYKTPLTWFLINFRKYLPLLLIILLALSVSVYAAEQIDPAFIHQLNPAYFSLVPNGFIHALNPAFFIPKWIQLSHALKIIFFQPAKNGLSHVLQLLYYTPPRNALIHQLIATFLLPGKVQLSHALRFAIQTTPSSFSSVAKSFNVAFMCVGCQASATVQQTNTTLPSGFGAPANSGIGGAGPLMSSLIALVIVALPGLLLASFLGIPGLLFGLVLGVGIGYLAGLMPFWLIIMLGLVMLVIISYRYRAPGEKED